MADPRPVGYYPDGYVALMPDGSRVLLAYPPGMKAPPSAGIRSKKPKNRKSSRKNRKGSRRANRRANRTNRKSSRKNRRANRK